MGIKRKKRDSLPLNKKKRIWELDFLRGLCVLLMFWDHLMYDIVDIFGSLWLQYGQGATGTVEFAEKYWNGGLREFFHPIIFCIFFVICGISCTLSRNNLLRGTKALILAFIITVGTSIIGTPILFGVIHMLAFAMIIYSIIEMICRRNDKAISIICFILGTTIIITGATYNAMPPDNITDNDWAFLAEFLQLGSYMSYDYFPLIPNVGYVLLGASVGRYWYRDKQSVLPMLDKYGWHKPIGYVGRAALPAYVLHQPIIFLILAIVSTAIIPDTSVLEILSMVLS